MINKLLYICVAVLGLSTFACRKYVDDTPSSSTSRTLLYTSDYRLLMNPVGYDGNSVETTLYGWPVLSGDDIYFTDSSYQASFSTYYQPIYLWSSLFFGSSFSDLNWETPYNGIYTFNTVINGVMASKDGSDSVKREIRAEAQLHRAFSYWALVNCYAKQFDSSTAASDLGVPLLLTTNMTASLVRSSVESVYDQVISDIQNAIPFLPRQNSYNTYPSKVAAYALLARVYLFTRNFTKASAYADSALSIYSTLVNYNTYISSTGTMTYPKRINDPEIILSKQEIGTFYPLQINPSLIRLLGSKDLRYQLFTRPGTTYSAKWTGDSIRIYWRTQYTYETNNIGLTTPELYLIKAECLARLGNVASAMVYLNNLRVNRYASADYVPATASSVTEAMRLIINERKKEFFGRGYEWFDLKRYNKDVEYQTTVVRQFKGTTYTLLPNSNRFVYPIGAKYISLNPEIVQNPE